MILTPEQIHAAITDGSMRAISIDTSIFDGQQLQLEDGLLKRMSQFKNSDKHFVLADVVTGEVGSHLRKGATGAASGLRKALKALGAAWQIPLERRTSASDDLLGDQTPEAVAMGRLDAYIESTGATILRADAHVAIGDLLSRYFQNNAPFSESGTKKHEFPDAIALLTLEDWAHKNDTLVLVVSKDNDWKRYCEASPRLVCINDLSSALTAFQQEAAAYLCGLLSQQFTDGDPLELQASIEAAINQQTDNIEYSIEAYSQFGFDEDGTEAIYTITNFVDDGNGVILEAVESVDDQLVAKAVVTVNAEIDAHFSFQHWDSIDKDYMSMGSGTKHLHETLNVEVLLTFNGTSPQNAELESVEVLPTHMQLDVGEIEPDWMNDPDNYDD